MGRLTAGLLLATAVALGGCGVPAQDRPETLDVAAPEAPDAAAATLGGQEVQIWLVRGDRLEAVSRPVSPADVPAALEALVAGPSPDEAASGLRTALPPQTLREEEPTAEAGVVTLAVTREFTGLVGGNQQLAVAQVVWTATQFPSVRQVRFTADGKALEVPTDRGLTDRPVDRDDYASVAPAGSATTGSPAPPPPTPSVPASSAPVSPAGRRPVRVPTGGGHR